MKQFDETIVTSSCSLSYMMPSQTQDDVEMGDSQVNGETVADEFDPTDNGALPRDNDIRLKLVSIRKINNHIYLYDYEAYSHFIVTW